MLLGKTTITAGLSHTVLLSIGVSVYTCIIWGLNYLSIMLIYELYVKYVNNINIVYQSYIRISKV